MALDSRNSLRMIGILLILDLLLILGIVKIYYGVKAREFEK
jgi:hypothetical protein